MRRRTVTKTAPSRHRLGGVRGSTGWVLSMLLVACRAPEPAPNPVLEPPPGPTPPSFEPPPGPTLLIPDFSGDDAFADIRALGAPEPLFVPSLTYTDQEIDDAVAGTAVLLGLPIELTLPFDWEQDPFNDRVYRLGLQAWWGLAPLLVGHATGKNPDGLPLAIALAVDWIETYRTPFEGQSEFAWNGSAVSFRAAYLAYIFRAGVMDGVLTPEDAAVLWEGMVFHGDFLEEGTARYALTNLAATHDVGLGLLALQLPMLPRAATYRSTAAERITPLAFVLLGEEALLREHTPWYHFLVLRDLERARRFAPELQDLFERGRAAGMWLVGTDGDLIQFGDSHRIAPQPDVVLDAPPPNGLATFERTGYGVARDGDSLLAVTSQFHSRVHKQRDDGTFAWFERGVRIISDTGRYGYYPGEPGRDYALSTRAHSVLTVDDAEFGATDEDAYGSGLVGGAEAAGWYVLVADNPLLLAQGVTHRRFWFYRPNEALVIVDDVAANAPRTFTRYLHLGASLSTRDAGDALVAEADGVRVTIRDGSATSGSLTVARGREDPTLLGFTYPTNRVAIPRDTVVLRHTLDRGLLVTALTLDDAPAVSARRANDAVEVTVDDVVLSASVANDVTLNVTP